MSDMQRLVFFIAVAVAASACTGRPEKTQAEERALAAREQRMVARLAKVDEENADDEPVAKWIMPTVLREISGIALTPDGRLLAHDDEISRVFEIDPRKGVILKSFTFGKGLKGDFEGITLVGQDIYVVLSNGFLYQFKEGKNGEQVTFTTHDTRLGKECEFEGVVYERDSARLVLPCKNVKGKRFDESVVLYRWRLGSKGSSGITPMVIPESEVIGQNSWKKFRASDITIDPATGNYVLISSLDKGLAVIRPDGKVVSSRPLPDRHTQPEGVAITRDDILIISDEATNQPPAVTLYRWRRTETGDSTQ